MIMQAAISKQSLMKQPSAWLPVVISLTALTVLISHLIIFGGAREPDEGATAHIWQLLMGLQVPLVSWFVFKWLRRTPGPASTVLAVQAFAALTAVVPVWFFKL
jgi:hypothetical protein